MSGRSVGQSYWRRAYLIAVVAALYYLTGRLGRMAAPPPGMDTVVWPPSGVALAALLLFGVGVWPGILIGAFLSNNWSAFHMTGARTILSFLTAGLGIDAGATLEALLGAVLIRRSLGARDPFERPKDTLVFVALALSASAVGSLLGVMSLCFGGMLPWEGAEARFWTWWIGDAGGILVIVPLVLVWWRSGWPRWSRARWIEAFALLIAIVVFAAGIFVWWHPGDDARYPADLLILPLVAWVAYRFTLREVTFILPIVLGIAVWGTIHGSGPFRGTSPWSTLPVAQTFIGVLSILSLTIGAVISERKQAAEALRESAHWLRESQRISQIGSYVLDLKLGTWTSSEILDEILGIDSGFARDLERWSSLIHPEDRGDVMEYLWNDVVRQRADFYREYRIVRPADGRIRWVLCRGELATDVQNAPAQLAGTILDITDRRNMEAELLQAQKMESIGRLAGGVAHDFNNLLTVINGYSDLVLAKLPSEHPQHSQVQEIRKAGERAAELTRQLLAFSRKQVLRPKVVNLNDVVRDSEKMLRRVIGEDIELICLLEPQLRPVEADPGQLHQVILNLAVNARDAMPEGGRLIIETANAHPAEIPREPDSEASARTYVRLTIRDTGHGMDAATLERAFEPFFTTKGIGEGTGLGLATVYGIVRQSAGHISVQSELGHGAVFRVYLPAVEGAVSSEPAPVQVSGGSGTILLAEDEEGVRAFITASLERHGYRVLPAAGADEALQVSGAYPDPIDLLVTDVVMPRMRGPELASRLVASRPKMKILYISGYSDPGFDGRLTTPAGARYLQKPFAADALLQAIRETLGRAEGTSRSAG